MAVKAKSQIIKALHVHLGNVFVSLNISSFSFNFLDAWENSFSEQIITLSRNENSINYMKYSYIKCLFFLVGNLFGVRREKL
jgi:hypothetical protein